MNYWTMAVFTLMFLGTTEHYESCKKEPPLPAEGWLTQPQHREVLLFGAVMLWPITLGVAAGVIVKDLKHGRCEP